jgi:hypothetical protein
MGYYYRFKSKTLQLKLPEKISTFISETIAKFSHHEEIPEHEFFKLKRWRGIFVQHADCRPPLFRKIKKDIWRLELDCDINYGHEEINEFAKWIGQYIVGHKPKQCIGWWKSEESYERKPLYIERELFGYKLYHKIKHFNNNKIDSSLLAHLFEQLNANLKNPELCDSFILELSRHSFNEDIHLHTLNALSPIKSKLKNWNRLLNRISENATLECWRDLING